MENRGWSKDQSGITLIELLVVIAILSISIAAIFGMLQVNNKVFVRESKEAELRLAARESLNNLLKDIQKSRKVEIVNDAASSQMTLYSELFDGGQKTYRLDLLDPDLKTYRLSVDGLENPAVRVQPLEGKPFFVQDPGSKQVFIHLQYADSSPNPQTTQLITSVVRRVSGSSARLNDLTVTVDPPSGAPYPADIVLKPGIFSYTIAANSTDTILLQPDYDAVKYQGYYSLSTSTDTIDEGPLPAGTVTSIGQIQPEELLLTIKVYSLEDPEDQSSYNIMLYGQ